MSKEKLVIQTYTTFSDLTNPEIQTLNLVGLWKMEFARVQYFELLSHVIFCSYV